MRPYHTFPDDYRQPSSPNRHKSIAESFTKDVIEKARVFAKSEYWQSFNGQLPDFGTLLRKYCEALKRGGESEARAVLEDSQAKQSHDGHGED